MLDSTTHALASGLSDAVTRALSPEAQLAAHGCFMIPYVAELLQLVARKLSGEPTAPPAWLADMLDDQLALCDGPSERERLRETGLWAAMFLSARAQDALAAQRETAAALEPPLGFTSWAQVVDIASGSVASFLRHTGESPRAVYPGPRPGPDPWGALGLP